MYYLLYQLVILFFLQIATSNAISCGCKASNHFRVGQEKRTGKVTVVGDMYFTDEDVQLFSGHFRSVPYLNRRWPKGEVIYEMQQLDSTCRDIVREVLDELSKATNRCVSFREIQQHIQQPYISIKATDGDHCGSYIGRYGTHGQELTLSAYCFNNHTIQHEFIHALGFYHEQTRPDRDDHVQINWGSIASPACDEFKKCSNCKTYTPYDVNSIMHYSSEQTACRRKPLPIVKKDGSKIPINKVLTRYDIEKIRKLYNCSSGPSPVQ